MDLEGVLPCTFHPFDDELLSSWIVRLADSHCMKIQTFCRLLFQNHAIWNRDIDSIAPDTLLQILAAKTLTSLQRIRGTTLKSYEGTLFINHNAHGNTKWILPYGIYHRERNLYGLLFCPCCLKNDGEHPYYRKHWRLAISTICPKCHVYLQDKCPNCKKPVVFFRNDVGNKNIRFKNPISHCYNCSFDLATSPTFAASIKEIRYQKSLNRILKEGLNREVIYPHLYFDVLFQILKILKRDIHSSNLLYCDLSRRLNNQNILSANGLYLIALDLPIVNRALLIKSAYWILDQFPKRFIPILKYHNFKSTELLRDFQDPPFWYYKIVIENFFFSNSNRRLITEFDNGLGDKKRQILAPINGFVGSKRKYSNTYTCKKCNSNWVIKNGIRNSKNRLKCRNCGAGYNVEKSL